MSEQSDKLITAARTWVNTPFQHQGRLKHIGVDCVNFISEVAKEAGVSSLAIPRNYRPHEDGKLMLQILDAVMEPVDEIEPGDVMALVDEACREPTIPRHVVIVTRVTAKTLFIIHASQHGVKEHRIDASWAKRVHSVWRLKNA